MIIRVSNGRGSGSRSQIVMEDGCFAVWMAPELSKQLPSAARHLVVDLNASHLLIKVNSRDYRSRASRTPENCHRLFGWKKLRYVACT